MCHQLKCCRSNGALWVGVDIIASDAGDDAVCMVSASTDQILKSAVVESREMCIFLLLLIVTIRLISQRFIANLTICLCSSLAPWMAPHVKMFASDVKNAIKLLFYSFLLMNSISLPSILININILF